MDEEIRLHLEHRIEQNIRQGMSLKEARHAARRNFGGVDQIKEEVRDLRDWVWLENLRRDIGFSIRSLRRSALFSLAVIITLTLCIGANTTIFSALYELVLKPLPYADPGQLVEVYNSSPNPRRSLKEPTSIAQYLDFKQNADRFENFAVWQEAAFTLEQEGSPPKRAVGAWATGDYFALLGVHPLLGRFYGEQEHPEQTDVVVLSQSLWKTNYDADPEIIGKVINVTGVPCRVIGVAPRSIGTINAQVLLFRPLEWNPNLARPEAYLAGSSAVMYARVKAGVSLSTALAQLNALERKFHDHVASPSARDFLDQNEFHLALGSVRAEQTKSVKTALVLLQSSALFVLLLGCVNLASLMLARANARRAELAVREALGADRRTLGRQLFIESLMLGMLGAGLGLAVAWGGLQFVNRHSVFIIRQAPPFSLDGTILAVTLIVSLAMTLLAGLVPALRLWQHDRHGPIQGGAPIASEGGRRLGVSGLLVTVQVALALMLSVGAGLLIHSFARVMALEPGFDASRVIHARIAFNRPFQDVAKAHATGDLIAERMREIPGVESASITSHPPVDGQFNAVTLPAHGAPRRKEPGPTAWSFGVSPEFFATMGLRVIDGRGFTAADNLPTARRTFVVDRNFAEKYFPGRSAVGQVLDFGNPNVKPDQLPIIIGVVEPARLNGPADQSGLPFAFCPVIFLQFGGFSLEVRTARPLADIEPLMLSKLQDVDPGLPIYHVGTLQSLLDETIDDRRGVMVLLGAFASIALLLSAVGIYGVLAYDVTQRAQEIGIRRAIGASRGQILTLILRQGLWKATLGLIVGLGGAFYLSRFMSGLLFDVRSSDPMAYLAVSLLLLLVALAASYLPARRAAKIDPIVALRCE